MNPTPAVQDEFGAHVKDPTEANRIALVRAQEEGCRAMVYVGTGEEPGLCSGPMASPVGRSSDRSSISRSICPR